MSEEEIIDNLLMLRTFTMAEEEENWREYVEAIERNIRFI